VPSKSETAVKIDSRGKKNGLPGAIVERSNNDLSANDNKTKQSGETLQDMEDFLRQLKAHSQLKGFKK
jgi:hypothetical protein